MDSGHREQCSGVREQHSGQRPKLFTIRAEWCSRCAGIGVHDGPEYAIAESEAEIAAELAQFC